ncbi:MAG: CHAT domain-containing protein [Planctomycetes bacterium]|nr:CHAT domain-containing protein [Planctomycetota bacterium]
MRIRESNRAQPLVEFRFPSGKAELAWTGIAAAVPEHLDGLPPGNYRVQLENAAEQTEFRVADPARRRLAMRSIDALARIVNDPEDPMFITFSVEALLSEKDESGVPLHLNDAWMALRDRPDASLTAHLRKRREQLLQWLEHLARDPGASSAHLVTGGVERTTGIPSIDAARDKIAFGRWDEALAELDAISRDAASEPRSAGLADTYRGVILSEAGATRERDATAAFEQAIRRLEGGHASDQYRAHVNYGNFLLRQAQDRLNNASFRTAVGVERPILTALGAWQAALDEYESALELADGMGDVEETAATRINLARLYALLADTIRMLDNGDPMESRSSEVEATAARTADRFAQQVTDRSADRVQDSATIAFAHELRAHLAFRAGDWEASRRHAAVARESYVANGRLAGVESVARLLGLVELRCGDEASALRQFLVSQIVAEQLREQFPSDQVGLGRAGFIARRSYVHEHIVELLIGAGRPAEALRYAELAKARSAQDVLEAANLPTRDAGPGDSLSELLGRWPRHVAVLEYFLGSRVAWVFLVDTSGQVHAAPLCDASGAPMPPAELIRQVRAFLAGINNHSAKMARDILSGGGFDHAWQNELHELHDRLIPTAFRERLREAKTVVVVPHHVLHYFPFAALVTELDAEPRGKMDMVRPRFLLDEPFDVIYAPSLATWDLLGRKAWRAIDQVSAVGVAELPGADPLPGVDADIENVRSVFGSRVSKISQGDAARESEAKDALRRPGLLVLATHGMNDALDPLESHLLFLPEPSSGDQPDDSPARGGNDGRLTAREVYGTRVRADVVLMNACYSGLGDRSPLPGDDLFGLQRAFLQSGSRVVVSGLWDVYDGTAPRLMLGFFKRVAAGARPSSALAESQRSFVDALRKSKKAEPWLHPYFWAVFSAAGSDGEAGPSSS